MAQRIINVGIADKGNGDPLRTAFIKANDNFAELFSLINNATSVDAVPPGSPLEGELWWDTNSGNLYIYYGGAWAPATAVPSNIAYLPSTTSDWSGTPPTTFSDALDRLAAVVKILNSGTGA